MSDRSDKNPLNALHDFVYGAPRDVRNMSQNDVREILKAHKVDSAPLFAQLQKEISQAKARTRLATGAEERKESLALINRLREEIRRATSPHGRQQILDSIGLALGDSKKAALFCQKFQDAPEEDLVEIVVDLGLLEALKDTMNDKRS